MGHFTRLLPGRPHTTWQRSVLSQSGRTRGCGMLCSFLLRLDAQVSRSQLYFKLNNWRKNIYKWGLKNPLYSVLIQIGFCFVTSHRTQLDLLMPFMFTPVSLTSSVLHGAFLFFFEILVLPLFYDCYYSGSVDISNLQVFSWLNWCQVTNVSFFFPPYFI